MDAKKLAALAAAADQGSFTRAAEQLGYTQSGLTHMMDALEREVGFSLLQRDHNGIQLSPQGRQLMPAIREFLQANANLENQINAISEQKKEVIRIAAYASIAMHWMPELLYRYKRVCPDVSVDLRMVDNALEPYELLESGQTDVIFASRQNYSFCDWTPLYNEKMYAILPKDYPLNGRTTFPLEEFSGQDFLPPPCKGNKLTRLKKPKSILPAFALWKESSIPCKKTPFSARHSVSLTSPGGLPLRLECRGNHKRPSSSLYHHEASFSHHCPVGLLPVECRRSLGRFCHHRPDLAGAQCFARRTNRPAHPSRFYRLGHAGAAG